MPSGERDLLPLGTGFDVVRRGYDRGQVEEHLDHCRRCTAMYLELDDVNSNLAGIIAPLLLGAAAAGYLSSGGVVGATGLSALFGRVRDAFGANSAGSGAGSSGWSACWARNRAPPSPASSPRR